MKTNPKEKASVSVGLIVLIGIVAVAALSIIWWSGTYNNLVSQENGIVAVHKDMQNVHASIFNQIKSQGLSVEKYGAMVTEALKVAVEGRYGKNGSQAAMQWIQEQNPTIDPKIMEKLQVTIEAGYNEFKSVQRTKLDRLRVYDNTLDSFITGSIAKSFMGFPKKVTDDMREVVSSAATKQMMETKEMETIDPFAKKAQ